jgi:hypothetical protein
MLMTAYHLPVRGHPDVVGELPSSAFRAPRRALNSP